MKKKLLIIGITGTLGAGKGAVVERLVEKYNFRHFSARDFLVKEIERRGLVVSRDTMTLVGNDLRATHGSSYMIEKLYEEAVLSGQNSVIESVRTLGEVEFLKSKDNFHFFAIDADQKLRYDRITLRKSSTDSVSFEKFVEDENREMNSSDPAKQNLIGCIKLADFVFMNDGDFDSLYSQIGSVMKNLDE